MLYNHQYFFQVLLIGMETITFLLSVQKVIAHISLVYDKLSYKEAIKGYATKTVEKICQTHNYECYVSGFYDSSAFEN